MGNITFQLSAPCEDSKGDFILHHFTEDSHNYDSVQHISYSLKGLWLKNKGVHP